VNTKAVQKQSNFVDIIIAIIVSNNNWLERRKEESGKEFVHESPKLSF
jgi:hypothetical protein